MTAETQPHFCSLYEMQTTYKEGTVMRNGPAQGLPSQYNYPFTTTI